jgi:hypothetical protein
MPNTRLQYVVVPLDGTLKRMKTRLVRKGKLSTIEKKPADVPAGYLVYFPRGHVLRMTQEQLEHHGLDQKPRLISLAGLHDPSTPLGRMMMAQDDAARAGAYQELEQQVMQLAIAKSGPVIMPEQMKATRFTEYEDHQTRKSQKAAA